LEESEAQIERYIVRGEDPGGHLVEQWLKLMVIVLIKQCNPNIRIRGELASTIQSGETTTYDHDMLHSLRSLFHRHHHASFVLPRRNLE
jgi:hypothetical protein